MSVNTRRVEVLELREDSETLQVAGHWEQIPFTSLEKGHIFRLFEDDGSPVDDGEVSVALGDAYQQDGTDTVQSLALKGFGD